MVGDPILERLVTAFVELTQEIAATDHVGRSNRLFDRREFVFKEIAAARDSTAALQALMGHTDPKIQLAIARLCKSADVMKAAALATLQRLAQMRDEVGDAAKAALDATSPPSKTPPRTPKDLAYLPLPGQMTRTVAEHIIRKSPLRDKAAELIALLRPAIGLWPIPDPQELTASRFGGMPAVPVDFVWPFLERELEGEPYLFLAQINCGELGSLAKAHGLPETGLLSFFGDHDDVNGYSRGAASAVYYFPELDSLKTAALPIHDFVPQISCGIGFYENCELPDPFSKAATALNLTDHERDAFFDLGDAISGVVFQQVPNDGHVFNFLAPPDGRSKLFGWPDLIQHELATNFGCSLEQRLLLQLGNYHNGRDWQCWGPGGLVYFTIAAKDLAARHFDRAELDMQST